jgi:hypothetical protein
VLPTTTEHYLPVELLPLPLALELLWVRIDVDAGAYQTRDVTTFASKGCGIETELKSTSSMLDDELEEEGMRCCSGSTTTTLIVLVS